MKKEIPQVIHEEIPQSRSIPVAQEIKVTPNFSVKY